MTEISGAGTGWRDMLSPGQRGAVLLISSGVGMHAFNDLAIAASIPVAYAALDSLPFLPLAYALFFLGVVLGGLLSAELRARLGARRTAVTGALLFSTGVALTALAWTGWVFALGRALQGLSDGIIVALCYGLIPDLIRKDLVARVFSVEAIVWAVAAGLGPLAGGYATEALGWRAAMLVCLPLVLVFFVAALPVLGEAHRRADLSARRPAGLPVLLALTGTLCFALPTALPGRAWGAALVLAGLALFALALRIDGMREKAFFPRRFFSLSVTGRGAWLNFLMPISQSATTVFLALALTAIWGMSPIWVGWIIITLALSWSGTAMVLSNLTVRQRAGLLRFGPMLQVAGLSCVAIGLGTSVLPIVLVGQVLSGASFGMVWGPATEVIMRITPEADKTRVSSFLPVLQTTGFAVGAGLVGWVAGMSGLTETLGTEVTAPIYVLWGSAAALSCIAATLALGMRPAADELTS
jgi:MFS family permease